MVTATLAAVGAVLERVTLVFTEIRCLCGRRVMAVPGRVQCEVRVVQNDAARSGRGRVVACARCRTLLEVIEHGS